MSAVTVFEAKAYGRHRLSVNHGNDLHARLSMDMACPNCGAECRHSEKVDRKATRAEGINRTDTRAAQKSYGLSYEELADLNKRASALFSKPPTHTIAECFQHLRSEVESLREELRASELADSYY